MRCRVTAGVWQPEMVLQWPAARLLPQWPVMPQRSASQWASPQLHRSCLGRLWACKGAMALSLLRHLGTDRSLVLFSKQ